MEAVFAYFISLEIHLIIQQIAFIDSIIAGLSFIKCIILINLLCESTVYDIYFCLLHEPFSLSQMVCHS